MGCMSEFIKGWSRARRWIRFPGPNRIVFVIANLTTMQFSKITSLLVGALCSFAIASPLASRNADALVQTVYQFPNPTVS